MQKVEPIYLSARWGRRSEMQALRSRLEASGFLVGCRWLGEQYDAYEFSPESVPEPVLEDGAVEDFQDVTRCGTLVAFTEDPATWVYSTGGRHVELGMAVAQGKRVIVVGPKENVFHRLPYPAIEDRVPDEDVLLRRLEALRDAYLARAPKPTDIAEALEP